MTTNSSTDNHSCIVGKTDTCQIVLTLCALPCHAFVVKILSKDFQFDLARHKILFCLSMSDANLVMWMFIYAIINMATTMTMESTGCKVYRGFIIFTTSLTAVVTSVSILALSVERYIACIHSFRLHKILTESRVRYGSICVWALGVSIGLLVTFTHDYDNESIIPNHSAFQYNYIIFATSTSVAISIIQVRLFIFSMKKMNRVSPTGAFGEELELADYRKKQIKIAFMAGIVAFAFIVCTMPLAVAFFHELLSGSLLTSSYRSVVILLSFSNSFVDPFIYGLGTADTRMKIIRDLKKLKQCLIELLPESIC